MAMLAAPERPISVACIMLVTPRRILSDNCAFWYVTVHYTTNAAITLVHKAAQSPEDAANRHYHL